MKKLVIKTTRTDSINLFNIFNEPNMIYREYGQVFRIVSFGYHVPETDTYIDGLLWETDEKESEHLTLYIEGKETEEEEAVDHFLTNIMGVTRRRSRRLLKHMRVIPIGYQYVDEEGGDYTIMT